MADQKVSELTAASAFDGSELFKVVQSGNSKKVALRDMLITPDEETGASYTFELADAFKTKIFNRGTAQAITIPTNASVAFPIGTRIRCYRKGAGLPTISPDGGVTLNKPTGIRPNRTMGCMAKRSVDQTTANYSAGAMIPFDGTDIYDTDAFHDPVTNNSRLTIPSGLGITKVRLTSSVFVSSTGSDEWHLMQLFKDGSGDFDGAVANYAEIGSTTMRINIASGPIAATTGYFEVQLFIQTDASVTIEVERTNFAIEVTEINPVGSITYQYGYVTIEKIGTNEWNIEGPALG